MTKSGYDLIDKDLKHRCDRIFSQPPGWKPKVGDLVRYQPNMACALDLDAVGVKLHDLTCLVRVTELVQNGGPYGAYGDPSVKAVPVGAKDVVVRDDMRWFAPLSPLEALAFQADE